MSFELKYCDECIQMTNHVGNECQKCKSKGKGIYKEDLTYDEDDMSEKEKKTSKEWEDQYKEKYRLHILDPDGWDRTNIQYSFYEEKITLDEFLDRLSNSTIQCDIKMFNDLSTNK